MRRPAGGWRDEDWLAVVGAGTMHSQQALKVASVVVRLALSANWVGTRGLRDLRQLRQWFFMAALLSIGYGLTLRGLREAGWRPLAVHALAAAFHTVLVLAWRA